MLKNKIEHRVDVIEISSSRGMLRVTRRGRVRNEGVDFKEA